MSNASKDRKITEFQALSSLQSDAIVTVVQNGTNYQMSLADFQTTLAVTGSIIQAGNVSATPVLEKAGAINSIRNIEDGPGILSSISPENGITLEHNFTQDVTGATLVTDLTVAQPVFRSIVAGDGISVGASGDTIQISATGTPLSTKTVNVTSISDLPAAVGGVITLAGDTEYRFLNDVSLGSSRLVLGADTVISGTDTSIITLTYTGSGNMITGVNVSSRIKNIRLVALSGSVFALSCLGTSIFEVDNCSVDCATLGTTTGFALIELDDTDITCTTGGLTFSGTNGDLVANNVRIDQDGGTSFALGAATFDSVNFDGVVADLAGGTFFLSGAAASANINAGGTGTVINGRFRGAGSPLSTISPNDALWQFFANDDIADTRPDGLLSMQANATPTTISGIGTPVLIAGTRVVEMTSQFTGTTGGRLTYNGGKNVRLPVVASISIAPVSGGAQTLALYLAKNGSVITRSKRTASVAAGGLASITMPWQVDMSPGDYLELFVANDTATNNVLVSSSTFTVN